MMLEGKTLESLQLQVEEQFDPGDPVDLFVGIERDLSQRELVTVAASLARDGLQLLGPVEIGTGPWPNTLRLQFRRPPPRHRGAATSVGILPAIPIVVMIVGALGATAVAGIIGWKLTAGIQRITENIGRYIVPLALVAGGVFILWSATKNVAAK